MDRRTGTEARFAKFNTTTGAQTNNYFDFRNSYVWDKLNRVDIVKQESANDPLAATWTAKASTTRTVDLNYFADSNVQTISRTQGATGSATAPMVTTFATVADGVKNEGRMASITQSGLTGGNVVYSYGYDDHGRVSSFTSPAGTRSYSYDSFDQLTGATGGTQTAEAYQFDKNGNRTGSGVIIGQYNRVTNDGTYTYLYDKEGNRTRRTLNSTGEYEVYVWDYRQRLVSVTKRSHLSNDLIQTVTYEYDGLDRRIRRTVSNASGAVTSQQRFLYDTNVIDPSFDEVVLVLDEQVSGDSYQKVDHRYLNGPAIDQVFADEGSGTGNQVLWYLSDQQNTVRDVAKYASTTAGSQATVRNHLEYDGFGNVTSVDDPSTGTANDGDFPGLEGVGNEYSPQRSYTGREPDPATGLIYYRARWFDPKLGRFISNDPIDFAAGDANLSRYVGNSTPNAVDPSGLAYFPVSSEEDQARALDGWLAWARSQGIGHFRFETLPEYVDPQGRRYERIRVWGTTSFYSAFRFNVRFDGPTSYHRIGGGANSDLDSAICRNRYGDVMVMPRQTREALSNATGSLLEQGEKVRIVTYAVVVIVVPGPDDVVISGVLATSVARRLAAAGYEVISDGMQLIIKRGGEELSDEAAGAARKLIQETIDDAKHCAPKSMHVGDAGHHVPAVRKSRGRPFDVERSDLSRPTIHVIGDEAAVGQAHWRMHNAERTHIGPRQGDFVGTDDELFEAYRKSYRDLTDIRVDVRSPDGSTILGRNVTLEEAVNLLESSLRGNK